MLLCQIDMKAVMAATNLYEFDSHIIVPTLGLRDADHYYAEVHWLPNSSLNVDSSSVNPLGVAFGIFTRCHNPYVVHQCD